MFFFFKQKTAYEMRISDWSSDVCSSDLLARLFAQREVLIFLVASALIQSSHAAYYGFSSLYWRASGIGETAIALLWAEGVVAEILFFALSRRFAGMLHPGTLLVGAGLLGTLRWSVTALTLDLEIGRAPV